MLSYNNLLQFCYYSVYYDIMIIISILWNYFCSYVCLAFISLLFSPFLLKFHFFADFSAFWQYKYVDLVSSHVIIRPWYDVFLNLHEILVQMVYNMTMFWQLQNLMIFLMADVTPPHPYLRSPVGVGGFWVFLKKSICEYLTQWHTLKRYLDTFDP